LRALGQRAAHGEMRGWKARSISYTHLVVGARCCTNAGRAGRSECEEEAAQGSSEQREWAEVWANCVRRDIAAAPCAALTPIGCVSSAAHMCVLSSPLRKWWALPKGM